MSSRSLTFLLSFGFLLSALGVFLVFYSPKETPLGHEVARLEVLSGSFQVLRHQSKKNLDNLSPLFILDRVESGPESQGRLKTAKGDVFRLFDSQAFTLDQQGDELRIILHHGELILEEKSELNQTFIVWEGQKLSLDQYLLKDVSALTSENSLSTVDSFETSEKPEAPHMETKKPQESTASISAEQLREFIQKNRQQFFKCYSSLLQKEPEAKGEVRATLTILKNGKVTQPSIIQSFTENKDFKNCLIQVLSRTDIPAFQGQKITTIVPIVFE